MNYIIKGRPGDKIRDVVRTIINFSDEEMSSFLRGLSPKKMYYVYIPNKIKFFYEVDLKRMRGRFLDKGLQAELKLLDLDEDILDCEDGFDKLINYGDIDSLVDSARDNNLDMALGFLGDLKDMIDDSFVYRSEIIEELDRESFSDIRARDVLERVNKLTSKDVFLKLVPVGGAERMILSKCFEILESDEMLERFLDFNNNRELFDINYMFLKQRDYVIKMAKFFGDSMHDINRDNIIYKFSFVTDEMISRYEKLRDIVNIDMDMLGNEPFGKEGVYAFDSKKQGRIDSDWVIDKGLEKYVFDDMDESYSIEEQVAHVYIKLCVLLEYNSSYKVVNYGTLYDKKRQEGISLSNPFVICSEFSKSCTKLFNNYLSDIVSSRCVIPSGGGHEVCGVLIKEHGIRIDMDATNAVGSFNDLSRAKLGLPLCGINYIYDRYDIFKRAFDRVYERLVFSRKVPVENLISAYESVSEKCITDIDFDININSFLEKMKVKKIRGNEMINSFTFLVKRGYFGDIKYSLVGEFLDYGVERSMLINYKDRYYVLRSSSLDLVSVGFENLIDMFNVGNMKYESDKYTLKGIGGRR